MKRVTKGDTVAEPGYFYTPEEQKEVEEKLKALDDIVYYAEHGHPPVADEPVGVKI